MKKSVMIRRRFLIQFALGSAGVLAAPLTAHTQLRSQPIKLIFPYVPGGTGDALARIIAEQMQEFAPPARDCGQSLGCERPDWDCRG